MSSRALASAYGLAVSLAASSVAWSQPAATFPAALDSASITEWLQANTSLAPSMVVSIGSSSIIGLRSVTAAAPPASGTFRASIWAEVVSAQTAATGRYLSWSADVDVDCSSRRSKAIEVVNYPERGLRGTPKPASGAAGWVTPSPGTQLYSLIAAVCDSNFRRPFSTAGAAATPPPRSGNEPARSSQAAAVPPASAPLRTAPAAAQPAPAQVAAAPSEAAPSPSMLAPALPPVAKVDILPDAPSAQAAPDPPAQSKTAARAAKSVALGRSRAAVQVAAGDSPDQASQTLKTVQRKFADQLDGLGGGVAKADVGGRTVYRVLIHGFASRADAINLCEALQGAGQSCFVRNDFQP